MAFAAISLMTPYHNDANIDDAVRQIREGDTAAYEVIVRRFERPLRTWLAGHSPPGIDVDEIAQRSLVVAYSRLAEYELGTNFASWLFTIARYQLKTETTRLRRIADYHTRYAPDLLQRELARRATEPPELVATRLEHLEACVQSLADHLRQYLTWRYKDEISLEEMATHSGRSIAAIKKQLWSIRKQLQECVENRMASPEGGI